MTQQSPLFKEEIKVLYEESINGLIVFRSEGGEAFLCRSCNPVICTFLGTTQQDLLGHTFLDIFSDDIFSQVQEVYGKVTNNRTGYPAYVVKGGNQYRVLTRLLTNEKGNKSLILSFAERWRYSPIFYGNEALLNVIQDAIFIFDVDADGQLRLSFLNTSHMETTGSNLKRDIGKTPVEIMGEETGAMLQAYYQDCLNTQQSIQYENKLYFPPLDKESWMQTRVFPVILDGKVTQIVGASRDVTAQHEAAEKIEKLFLEYEALFNETAIPIWYVDVPDDQDVHSIRLRRYNTYYEQVFGPVDLENGGNTIEQNFQDPELIARVYEKYSEVLYKREPITFEFSFGQGSSDLHTMTTLTPIIREGKITNIIGSSLDITELRQYQDMLKLEGEMLSSRVKQQTKALQSSFDQQDTLLMSITEAIQEPLVSILGMLEMVQLTLPPSDPKNEYIKRIIQQTEALLRLVEGILGENEGEAEEVLRIRSFNIKELVQTVIQDCITERPAFHSRIEFIDRLPMQTIWQDEQRVYRILQYLMQDWIRKMEEGEKLMIEALFLPEEKQLIFTNYLTLSESRFIAEEQADYFNQFDQTIEEDLRLGLDTQLIRLLAQFIGGTLSYEREQRTAKMVLTIPLIQELDQPTKTTA